MKFAGVQKTANNVGCAFSCAQSVFMLCSNLVWGKRGLTSQLDVILLIWFCNWINVKLFLPPYFCTVKDHSETYHFICISALIFRGLDALTTDQSLMGVVNTYTNFSLTIKNCHVARDPFTHVSRGFAFVEMNSIQVLQSIYFWDIFVVYMYV